MRTVFLVLLYVLPGFVTTILKAQDVSVSPLMVGTGTYLGLSKPLREIPAMTEVEFRKMALLADKPRNEELQNRSYPFEETALPKGNDPAWQKEMGNFESGKAPIVSFDGQISPYYPPDANGATGPNHFMQTVNASYSIYNKTGNRLVGPTNLNLLFAGVTGSTCNDGDPILLYDEQADRWIVAEFSICGANDYMLVAVSQTNDPTGSWHCYSFDVADMPDYEKFGIWRDGYYMATNTPGLNKSDIYVFQRSQMLIGGTAQMVGFDNPYRPTTIGGFVCVPPVDNDGAFAPAGSPGIFVAFNDDAIGGGSDQLWVYELAVNWTTPASSTFVRVQELSVASFDSNFGPNWNNISQLDPTKKLDAIPQVVMNVPQYRNFGTYQTMVLCHTVDVDNTDHAGIRWYELRKTSSTWSVRQQGTYAPDAHSRWMASISLSGYSSIGLGYSISSSTINPGIRYTGQSPTEYATASGILDVAEQVIISGTTSQTAYNRWGDYSSICLDPTDDFTFWYTNQYIGTSTARKTRIASFQIGSMPAFPDLTVLIPAANPASISAGLTTTASCTILNQGTASAQASVLKYYLSSDNAYNAGDLLLGSDNVPALNITQTTAISEIVTIPVATVPGTWYILFFADANLQVAESNETNNVGYFQITVTPEILNPDLTILNPAVNPVSIEAGQTTTGSCTVKNIGNGLAPASVLKYYLSSNNTFSGDDLLLGSDNVGALASLATINESEIVTIPLTTTAGTWFILFFADADGLLTENNETNNVGYKQITVTTNGWIICPQSTSMCISEASYVLSGGLPVGGTYSGDGVVNGVFYPQNAGTGNHQISYCFTFPSQQTVCCNFDISVTGAIFNLPAGWSGLSSNIVPDNPVISSIMNPLGQNLTILYNYDGMYWPEANIYTISNWNSFSGYFIKVAGTTNISFCGSENQEKTLNLPVGWSLIPVLGAGSYDVEALFANAPGLVVLKEIAGMGVFWRDYQINTLGTCNAGKAYLVLMNSAGTITFPPVPSKCSVLDTTQEEMTLSPWNEVVASPASHIIAFDTKENPFEKDDIVGGFTPDGLCAGFTTIENPTASFALSLNGKGPITPGSEGFEAGSYISYRLFRPGTSELFSIEVICNDAFDKDFFKINGLSVINSAKISPVLVSSIEMENLFIYPNPSDGIFMIGGIKGLVKTVVTNSLGKEIKSQMLDLPARLDLSSQTPGIYFIKIENSGGRLTRKLLID